MSLLDDLKKALYRGDADAVDVLTQQGLAEGIGAKAILQDGLIKAMDAVGVDFRSGELFVPEVLIAARAMKAGMAVLRPLFVESGIEPVGRVILGTVKGDLHDIGKNLVGMMLEGGGFEVLDLGVDVPPEKFVGAIKEQKPNLVGMSALLTTTMVQMKTTIEAIAAAGLREQVRIMVGGAPVTEAFAEQIGADAFGADAALAVLKAKELLESR